MRELFCTENQIEQLKKAGCEPIYTETASGGRWERPQLQACLKHLRRGDVLVVWKLDRQSRSLSDLLRILQKVDEAGAGFKSLTESVDTTTPSGRLTKLGLARARANGHKGGGKYILSATRQAEVTRQILSGEKTQSEVARDERVSKSTISRMMSRVKI